MRRGLSRTIAVAATAAVAASGAVATATDRGGGSDGGSWRGQDYATIKSGRTLVLFDGGSRKYVGLRGLLAGERVVGIDVRPGTGALYGVSSADRVFTINPHSGRIGDPKVLSVPLDGTFFGVDFNPSVDRLRITSDTDQNLRADVDTGATLSDGALHRG